MAKVATGGVVRQPFRLGEMDGFVVPLGILAPREQPQEIHIHIHGALSSPDALVDAIHQALLKKRRRNGALGLK
jgi:hypothetical protein